MNQFSFQHVHRVAHVHNQSRCCIWGNCHSYIWSGIVIGSSGCTIIIRQAISVSIKCILHKSINSCLVAHSKNTSNWILRDNILVIFWGKIFNCCRKRRVINVSTAISNSTLTVCNTLRACIAVLTICASWIKHCRHNIFVRSCS